MKKRTIILTLTFFIILQTIIYVIVGSNKEYLHIDEAFSFGLSNYERVNIQDNKDFFDNWHKKEYYEDFLVVNEDEKNDYKPVYENQKNDVHPPFYYLILRFAMELNINHFSKWTGIIVNIIIYGFITIFMYLILKKLLKNESRSEIKSMILAFVSSIILASLSNAVYIRMYSLLTLEILITTYLHMRMLETEEIRPKLLIAIGISSLLGILTHYYYLFYIGFMYLTFFIKYLKQKKYKKLIYYTLTNVVAGIVSLIIFPYSINHMFFGYRGQGVISKLEKIPEMIDGLFNQIYNLSYYGFNHILVPLLIIIVLILVYKKATKNNKEIVTKQEKEMLQIIAIPSVFFFIMASLSSPWNVLRYIVPVLGLMFVLAFFTLYMILKSVTSQKVTNILVLTMLIITLILPIPLKMKPELLFEDKKGIVEKVRDDLNVPTIYLFDTSKGNNFIDEILLFANIDESYIAKDLDLNEESIRNIFKNRDVSKGVIILINEEDEEKIDEKLEIIKNVLNLKNIEFTKKLSSSKMYYIK